MSSLPSSKRSRETSGPSAVRLNSIVPDWSFDPGNRYLFHDETAFLSYYNDMGKDERPMADCYFFRPMRRIPIEQVNLIRAWFDSWSLGGLADCDQPYHPKITRLFYANLRVSFNHFGSPSASSYLFGRHFYITTGDLANFLQATNTANGSTVYAFQRWPQGFGSYQECRQWFRAAAPDVEKVSTEHLPALHRFLFLVINDIIFPQGVLTHLAKPGSLFYLRNLIQKQWPINLAHMILFHMHQVAISDREPLPYGHLIEALMLRARIRVPEMLWGNRVSDADVAHPANLIFSLPLIGWVESSMNMLVPDPNQPVNDYLLLPNAAPNQYGPMGADPPSDDYSAALALDDPAPVSIRAFIDQRFGELNARLEALEGMLQAISVTLNNMAGGGAGAVMGPE